MAPRTQSQGGNGSDDMLSTTEGVTIHQLNRDAFEDDREYSFAHSDIRFGEKEVTSELVDEKYEPVETVIGTTDLDEAYHRAQGVVVNEQQGGRHGVPSASVGDVFEVVESDGSRRLHLVERIGFSEVS